MMQNWFKWWLYNNHESIIKIYAILLALGFIVLVIGAVSGCSYDFRLGCLIYMASLACIISLINYIIARRKF